MSDDILAPTSTVRNAVRLARGLAKFDPLDRVLVVLGVLLSVGTALAVALVGYRLHVQAVEPDIVIDTVATLVTASVAALAWVRFRERREVDGLFHASAFLVAMTANAYALVLVLVTLGAGWSPLEGAGQLPIYISTTGRALAAVLLVAVGMRPAATAGARRPGTVLLLPSVVLLAAIPALALVERWLPHLTTPFTAVEGATPPASTLGGALVQIGVAMLFMWAASVARASWRATGSVANRYLSIALVFAAFAQVHIAFFPGTYPGLVASGDLLRLLFDLTLLLGIEAETTATLRNLRLAYQRLEVLKNAEAERGLLEERARLSRELHDGLAQDLWLAKLKVARLATEPDLSPSAAVLCREVKDAVDGSLTEAQQAIMALRMTPSDNETPLANLLGHHAADFADRFGIRVELTVDPDLPRLPPRAEAELLRIAQEGLTNARRHADATVIRVDLVRREDAAVLSVRDNGRGFDVEAVGEGHYGLAGMRERARLIHGSLEVRSGPSDGTRVSCAVPLAQPDRAGVGA